MRNPLKLNLAPEFCRNHKKNHQYFNWNSYQPWSNTPYNKQLIRLYFFGLLEIVIQKECFFCFIWVLKVSLRLTLIQKGGFCPLRLSPLMRVLCLCPFMVQHQRTAGLGVIFWRTTKLYAEQKWGKWKQNNAWRLKLYYG